MKDPSKVVHYYEKKKTQQTVKEISFEQFKACQKNLIFGNPFLRPSIFEITWRNLYQARDAVFLALYDDSSKKIQHVLPCYRGVNWRNGVPFKYFNGFTTRYGEKAGVLSTVENEADVFLKFMEYIITNKKYWDRVVFSNIPSIQALTLREWLVKKDMIVLLKNSYVRVAEKMSSFEEYMQHQADQKKILKHQKTYLKYLKRYDPLTFKVFYDDSVLDTIFDIGNRSWKATLKTNIGHPELRPFISELVKYLSSIGALRIYILYYQDRPIAYDLCAILYKCCYGVKIDYDEAYKAWNPGNTLKYLSIKHVHEYEKDVTSFDFLSNYPYMKTWANQTAEYATVTIFKGNTKGRLLNFILNTLKPTLKKQFAFLNR